MNRRRFLQVSAAASSLALGRPPAFAQGTRLHLLQWSHFIPAADQVFEAQARDFGKQAGVEIAIDNFGSAYSSLGLVRGFSACAVKIVVSYATIASMSVCTVAVACA